MFRIRDLFDLGFGIRDGKISIRNTSKENNRKGNLQLGVHRQVHNIRA
jgi:hypothetical protein